MAVQKGCLCVCARSMFTSVVAATPWIVTIPIPAKCVPELCLNPHQGVSAKVIYFWPPGENVPNIWHWFSFQFCFFLLSLLLIHSLFSHPAFHRTHTLVPTYIYSFIRFQTQKANTKKKKTQGHLQLRAISYGSNVATHISPNSNSHCTEHGQGDKLLGKICRWNASSPSPSHHRWTGQHFNTLCSFRLFMNGDVMIIMPG